MSFELQKKAKCRKLSDSQRKTQRMCIAVTEEENEDIMNSQSCSIEFGAKEIQQAIRGSQDARSYKNTESINIEQSTKQTKDAQNAITEKANSKIKEFALSVCAKVKAAADKCSEYIKKNLIFDTVVGREEHKGSFMEKLSRKAYGAKSYINHEKNRSAVAFGAAAALAATAFVVVVLNFSVGFEAVVNGQTVGTVSSKQECQNIINEVNSILVDNFGQDSAIDAQIVAIPRLVARDGFTDREEVKNTICTLSDKMHEMYVISLEGEPLCALTSESEAKKVLESFRDYYTGGDENVTFETDKELKISAQQAPMTLLRSPEEALEVLNGSERKENEYTVQPGDTLWGISRKFDTSVDEILAINPDLTENIVDGDIITVKSYVPVVTVTTTQIAEYTKAISFDTEVVETDSLYRGKSEIAREGENGEVEVVANVIKQNGQEIEREIISEVTTKEPVTQIKKVGTKEPPSGYGTGSFIAPVYGTITSRFGYRRSGYHKGLDIANSVGTPIRAADNGRVIFAGWDGTGFGKLVKLDHQNGYITYYGHNSRIAVSVGQTVQKGDIIAYMGSTGNSTGPHCHFEMYKNGVLQNPANYI